MTNDFIRANEMLQTFKGESFAKTVAKLENLPIGLVKPQVVTFLKEIVINDDLLRAALLIKRNASRIDEIVHAIGILVALPKILDQDEQVQSLSLAAGNTGKKFDLETSKRIAEFTFIEWQGGPEVIRQNKIFKDFYFLAEEETIRIRELYVVGTDQAIKFFTSQRQIPQILKGNAKLGDSFRQRYGNMFKFVSEYYETKKNAVIIKDVRHYLPLQTKLFFLDR